MKDHFKRNHNTWSEGILDKVIFGGSLSEEIQFINIAARKYINKATLAKNANLALTLEKAKNSIYSNDREAWQTLWHEQIKLYDTVQDDLFIIAAFENYAKAKLLSKRYVVHTIQKPKSLQKKQKESPIHINTIRSDKSLQELKFVHKTIGIATLLKPDYIRHLELSDKAIKSIQRCQSIRNEIHFGGVKVAGYGLEFYEGLSDLYTLINNNQQ